MKIFYSPYFNGKAYVNFAEHRGGLLGEEVLSTAGLLARLELMMGLSYPDLSEQDEEARVLAYYKVLGTALPEGAIRNSYQIDVADFEEKKGKEPLLLVTRELLTWRDRLLMAGCDLLKVDVGTGKIWELQLVEKQLEQDAACRRVLAMGIADRWAHLAQVIQPVDDLEVVVCCPALLVDPVVNVVLEKLGVKPENWLSYPDRELNPEGCTLTCFHEKEEAYQWLAMEPVKAGTVAVCADRDQLDSVCVAFGKPSTSCKGAHRVTDDVRNVLDMPAELVWLDCNGDYGFSYPYAFLNKAERACLSLPSSEEMAEAVHGHLVTLLNRMPVKHFILAKYDKGEALTEHPMVAALLHKHKLPVEAGCIEIAEKDCGEKVTYEPQAIYNINRNLLVKEPVMSVSGLDQLVDFPFTFTVEKVLGMYEPNKKEEILTEKGKVAHKVVELMVTETGQVCMSAFDAYLEKAMEAEGSLLAKAENLFEYEEFCRDLKESLATLDVIIQSQGLVPVACEMKLEGDLPPYGHSVAFIDMVLEKKEQREMVGTPPQKKYVLFDFKYSISERHKNKLANNTSTQFEFYTQMFNKFGAVQLNESADCKVKAYGYYQFPLKKLFVPTGLRGGDVLKGAHIEVVEPDSKNWISELSTVMENSYKERIEELEKGLLEEAEDMALKTEGLVYPTVDGLLPIHGRYKTKKLTPYTKNHIVLKNQIK